MIHCQPCGVHPINSTTSHCWSPLSPILSIVAALLYPLLIIFFLPFWANILDVSIQDSLSHTVLIITHEVS